MNVLVLGGAGYIGSHAVHKLLANGFNVIVVDNLQTGHKQAVHSSAIFYQGDIRNKEFLGNVFKNENISIVIHFAASSLVGESMSDPLQYFNNNVYGTQVLLETMKDYNVKHIVFSSTAAVYGEPASVPITEEMPVQPTSIYGETKLMMEKMMKWCDVAYGIRFVSLRYFNVAGAHNSGELGEDHKNETHLIPIVLQVASGKREHITIYGEDYDTIDGTCIRDYIHVEDLIDAHILALKYLLHNGQSTIINLGTSKGFSVKEIIEAARKITQKDIKAVIGLRRSGDPGKLIASSDKAKNVLGWIPAKNSIDEIITDAWRWHMKHPLGFSIK